MDKLRIDQTLMNCVINGTIEGMEMTEIVPEAVGVSRFHSATRDISIIVGLHGKSNGNMTLNMSERTAVFLAGKLLGIELSELDEDAIDAVCEIGNIVAGRFKELLLGTHYEFNAISLPAMIFGGNYNMYHLKNIMTVSVTYEIAEVSIVNIKDKFFTSSISLLGIPGKKNITHSSGTN
jgi:CheY-specific phosphatase CheX